MHRRTYTCMHTRTHAHMYACTHSHYFVHGGWLEEDDYLLANVDHIRHIPATIVQGRYDLVTPMKTAWQLHKVRATIRSPTDFTIMSNYCRFEVYGGGLNNTRAITVFGDLCTIIVCCSVSTGTL